MPIAQKDGLPMRFANKLIPDCASEFYQEQEEGRDRRYDLAILFQGRQLSG